VLLCVAVAEKRVFDNETENDNVRLAVSSPVEENEIDFVSVEVSSTEMLSESVTVIELVRDWSAVKVSLCVRVTVPVSDEDSELETAEVADSVGEIEADRDTSPVALSDAVWETNEAVKSLDAVDEIDSEVVPETSLVTDSEYELLAVTVSSSVALADGDCE
jgi:hypothetical protein